MNTKWNELRQRRRAELKWYLGGKCKSCGTKENLQFDHIDPTTKYADIYLYINSTLVYESVWKEIDKCQLLCSSCHKKKTKAEHNNGTYKQNKTEVNHA